MVNRALDRCSTLYFHQFLFFSKCLSKARWSYPKPVFRKYVYARYGYAKFGVYWIGIGIRKNFRIYGYVIYRIFRNTSKGKSEGSSREKTRERR